MADVLNGYAILWGAMFSWIIAQALKLIISLIAVGKIDLAKLFDSGGMPSSHSALVASLCTSVGLIDGWDTTAFAICAVLAAIIIYDATGIRRSAGEHAAALNDIIPQLLAGKFLKEGNNFPEKYKELLGHNPFEVIVGLAVGVLVTLGFLIGYNIIKWP